MDTNYICTNGGTFFGYNECGKNHSLIINTNDRVRIDFGFVPYNPYIGGKETSFVQDNGQNADDKYARINIPNRDAIIYAPQQPSLMERFRLIKHKHLEMKIFDSTEDLNKWLLDTPIDDIKDIKTNELLARHAVTYINMEDD